MIEKRKNPTTGLLEYRYVEDNLKPCTDPNCEWVGIPVHYHPGDKDD